MELDKRFTACRLCLCPSENLVGVFDCCDGYIPAEMITELIRFEVSLGDVYPQCVCGSCLRKLTDFKKFKELCCIFKASLDRAYSSQFVNANRKPPFVEQRASSHEQPIPNAGEVIVPDDFNALPLDAGAVVKVNSRETSRVKDEAVIAISIHSSLSERPESSHEQPIPNAGEVIVPDNFNAVPLDAGAVVKVNSRETSHAKDDAVTAFGIHSSSTDLPVSGEKGEIDSGKMLLTINDASRRLNSMEYGNAEHPLELQETPAKEDSNVENAIDGKRNTLSPLNLDNISNEESLEGAALHCPGGEDAEVESLADPTANEEDLSSSEENDENDTAQIPLVDDGVSRNLISQECRNAEDQTEVLKIPEEDKNDVRNAVDDRKNILVPQDLETGILNGENSEGAASPDICRVEPAELEDPAGQKATEEDLPPVNEVGEKNDEQTRSKSVPVAKESSAQPVDEAQELRRRGQRDDANDPMEDHDDSGSDFQPDVSDSDMSDSSDEEFMPSSSKRSKVCLSQSDVPGTLGISRPHENSKQSFGVQQIPESSPRVVKISGETSKEKAKVRDAFEREEEDISSTSSSSSSSESEETDEDERMDEEIQKPRSSEKGVFDCSLCGKRYFQRRSFRYHMEAHEKGNRFKCETCGKAFSTRRYLKGHLTAHVTEKNFPCDVCGTLLKSKQILYKHKKRHGEKKIICELCGRKFAMLNDLRKHLLNHAREKTYPCGICGRGFTQKCNLGIHIKNVHLKQRKCDHCCTVCGKKYDSPAALKIHEMTHTGERPFTCSVCGKGCKTKNQLNTHMNYHTKEKSYKCDICEAVLSSANSLSRHKERHSGESKYKCDKCGKEYTQSHNLKNHQKKHHTD